MSTCTAQSDSMQENHIFVALGEDGKKKRGERDMTIRGGRHGGGDEGRGMRGLKS